MERGCNEETKAFINGSHANRILLKTQLR